jgi:hypothetical protein
MAETVDEILEQIPFPVLYQQVRIEKGFAHGFGKHNPYGALAAGGHSDQDDIVHFSFTPFL